MLRLPHRSPSFRPKSRVWIQQKLYCDRHTPRKLENGFKFNSRRKDTSTESLSSWATPISTNRGKSYRLVDCPPIQLGDHVTSINHRRPTTGFRAKSGVSLINGTSLILAEEQGLSGTALHPGLCINTPRCMNYLRSLPAGSWRCLAKYIGDRGSPRKIHKKRFTSAMNDKDQVMRRESMTRYHLRANEIRDSSLMMNPELDSEDHRHHEAMTKPKGVTLPANETYTLPLGYGMKGGKEAGGSRLGDDEEADMLDQKKLRKH
ncbi:hypothetical protein TRVA0_011S02014 [Trichomonascus vanleenenianus]|uniref:uncharacterized protein n=1 Tax=Trichomonascus vanleenenianus TaxID=2268995 RepID=UPI003ECA0B00